jgi:hypothetical protein
MKVAILVSGQCRTLDLCLPSLRAQIFRHFPLADLWVSVANGPDAGQANLFTSLGMRIRLLEAVDQPVFDERDYRQRSGVGGRYWIGTGGEDRTIVQRILRQAWHLRRVYERAAASRENYDVYIRLRPDQWFIFGAAGFPIITPETAAVPWWGGFDGVNDRFAILGGVAAEAYCWWPRLDQFLAEGCRFHPETLTKFGLDRARCRIVFLPALAATFKRDENGNVLVREPEICKEDVMLAPGSSFLVPARE